jgi:hypothetical protein
MKRPRTKEINRPVKLDPALSTLRNECATAFMVAFEVCRARGEELGLTGRDISLVAACEAIRAQALAIVAGNFPLESFDGFLAREIAKARIEHGDLIKSLQRTARPQ